MRKTSIWTWELEFRNRDSGSERTLSEPGHSRTRPVFHSSPDLAWEHRHLEPLHLKWTQGEVQFLSRGALPSVLVCFYSHSP